MLSKEVIKERKRKGGKIYVREWKPGEWREATDEEVEELGVDSVLMTFYDHLRRMRKAFKKIDEALEELWG